MANAFYVKGAEKLLAPLIGGSALPAGTLKAALVSTSYPQSLSADEFYDDISAYVVGTPQEIETATVTGGKLDGNDCTFPALSGDPVEAIVIYIDTGVPGESPLIAYVDQVTGFPYTPTGVDYTPRWDGGTYRIVSLV